MKISTYHSYDELPLFLNAELVAKVLGVSISSAYELMHETGFPALRIGSRIVVPKEKFCRWDDAQSGRLEVPDENLDKARSGQELFSSAQ